HAPSPHHHPPSPPPTVAAAAATTSPTVAAIATFISISITSSPRHSHRDHLHLAVTKDDLKDIVDFEVAGEKKVVITRNTTDDPWLNKFVGNETFIGQTDDAIANLGGRFIHEENDPKDDIVDPKDVSKGKCAAFKGKKPKDKNINVECSTNSNKADSISKADDGECSSKPVTKKNAIERKRPNRPRKQRIKYPTEDDNHVSRVGRVMHCHTYWDVRHNTKGCRNQPRPKPPGMAISSKSQTEPNLIVDQSRTPTSKPPHIPTNSKGKRIDMGKKRDGNLTAEEYQHKMDMEALVEVQREIVGKEAEQERIRQIWDENEANDLYWENLAKDFRDDELNRPEDSLESAYSFDTFLEF
nr:hypothetical protein [Tanacetum cinerariifolium]